MPSRSIEDTLYELPEVALVVVYGEPERNGGGPPAEVPVAAVVLRDGARLDGGALFAALAAHHPVEELPRRVHVVPALPMTEGFRPLKAALRAEPPSASASLDLDALRHAYVSRTG